TQASAMTAARGNSKPGAAEAFADHRADDYVCSTWPRQYRAMRWRGRAATMMGVRAWGRASNLRVASKEQRMLGERIGEDNGKVTSQRVLPSAGGAPRVETSFKATGSLLGVSATETGTYISTLRPDGTLYGEGQGIMMGKGGESATWVGQGVGTMKPDGSASFRGAIYYTSTSPAWKGLNSIAGVF